MTITLNGIAGITYPDSSIQASSQVGIKNRVIDGGFILNQRVYVSGTSLASGVYAHDRWKGGASGCTYTFTQGALGVNTTITITAGSLIQVIEGCNLAEGGTYVLSWTGTAQGRLNGGSYGASGTVTVTSWTAGTNLNVEFNTGTVGSVQLEVGNTATTFDYRDYGRELIMCQRYYSLFSVSTDWVSGNYQAQGITYSTTMRVAPTRTASGSATQSNIASFAFGANSVDATWGTNIQFISTTANARAYYFGQFSASAEL
jgi:hypothetical protein